MTTVVNLKKNHHYDEYIGRPSIASNPFKLKPGETRGSTLDKFRKYFYHRISTDPEFKKYILSLKGKRLACYCKPHPCHGDIIAEYLNNIDNKE